MDSALIFSGLVKSTFGAVPLSPGVTLTEARSSACDGGTVTEGLAELLAVVLAPPQAVSSNSAGRSIASIRRTETLSSMA